MDWKDCFSNYFAIIAVLFNFAGTGPADFKVKGNKLPEFQFRILKEFKKSPDKDSVLAKITSVLDKNQPTKEIKPLKFRFKLGFFSFQQ